jgi:hypothetical protein
VYRERLHYLKFKKRQRRDEMFWDRKQREGKEVTLPGPKAIPDTVGRHMVVQEKADPDWVWQLRGVVRPAGGKKTFYCRVFNEAQVAQAGVKVKDWTSLNDHPALILREGYFNEKTNEVRNEKFVKDSNSLH